ncbi:MAG TPA: hypothetical protein VJ044_15195, partial [Candidatus Hodarchaeales archaeon]|nr:hypothetical protein [Candidatus Hodarchaeales archaeon]
MIQWNLENIRQGENGELLVTGSFDVKNLEEISTGSVEVTFDSKEQLFSGVKIAEEDKRTAATRSNYVVESTEREEQPDYWDSKFIYQNSSEFPIKILGVKVSDEKQTYFEISSPVTVPAGNTWESPAWESFSETQPSFNKEVKLTVGSDVTVTSEAILGLEETQLVVANIEGDKIYIGEDGTTISEVPSYRETPIPTQIKIKNIGKITYESLKIDDTTPAHFLPSNPDTVKIIYVDMKGREDELSRSEFDYVSEPSDDNADKDHKGIFTIKRQCDPEGQFRVVYSPRAVRPLPDHEYVSKTHITAVLVKKAPPLELELVEQQPKLTVVHERRRISVGKDVLPGAKPKEYRITIVYTNKGSHSLKAVALRDFVPEEFEFSDDEVTVEMPGAGKEKMDMTSDTSKSTVQDAKGDVREWTFPEI